MNKPIDQVQILIAEDSATQAEQLRYLLEENNYQVDSTRNGREALAQLEKLARLPDLVISDIVMPELDGYGLCKAIKSSDRLKQIPVILVTTLSDPEDVIKGLECGADNFIRKPYDEKYLLSRIDYLLMNLELRKSQRMQMALEISLGGHKHVISAERQQILDLLVSTYEQAVNVNNDLKQREQELAHSNLVLQGLNRIAEGLNSVSSEQQVADIALQRALELPGVKAGWIFLRTGESGFQLAASRGLPEALRNPTAFDEECDCQRKLLTGELGTATNILDCQRLASLTGDTGGLCCHASVPLWLGEDHLLGVMNLSGLDRGVFDEEQLKILFSVGNQVAVALERARLHEHIEALVVERTTKLSSEIEERRRIEQEQARLVAIIEATPDFVATATVDGEPIFINRAGRRMLGLDPEQGQPRNITDTHPDQAARDLMDSHIPYAIEHGSWSGETRLRRQDGTELPVSQVIVAHKDAKGRVEFLSTIMRDISARVEADRTIQEALATLDASDDAAYIFDPESLKFSYVNEGAVRTLGYSRDELMAMTPMDFKPGYDAERIHAMLAPMVQGELRTYRYTTIHRHKDGHDIPVEVNFQYVTPKGGKPRFIAIARDITEQHRSMRKLQRLAASLEAANAALEDERKHLSERVNERTAELTLTNEQLAQAKAEAEAASRAKSAFLATMSHEIRTPMNGVIGMVDVLAQSKLSEHQADLAGTIRESANSLLGIIDDILDFSKIEAGRLELEHVPVSVTDLVEGLCNSLVPVAARKGVDLTLFISPDVPEQLLSDDVRLRQVLYNLVGNAIKFSSKQPDKRGRVSIRLEVVQPAPLRLSLRIADNGIGMSEDTVRGLFTPFTQAEVSTTRHYGGTGLGLTICKRLVDMMQGEITVASRPGEGSTFTVTLPVDIADKQPVRLLPDLSDLDCIVMAGATLDADDIRIYLEHAGARVYLASDETKLAGIAAPLPGPVVLIREHVDDAATNRLESVLGELPALRQLAITRGRRRRARVEQPDLVTLDGNALRRQSLLRAVAVAAGRSSPEIFRDRAETLSADEVQPPTIAEARAQGRLILVVEDDEINQKVILQQLALLGYTAEVAGNGVEALRMMRDGKYALLLTDLHMPEMDGYTLAETIRDEETGDRHIPILALTANALRGEANRALDVGMDEYLTKPVQLKLLQATLEKWLPQPDTPGLTAAATEPVQTDDTQAGVVLDPDILHGLVGDDPAIINDFLNSYLASSRQLAVDIRDAVTASDARQVGALAHRLKSSSRSVGALALGDLCAELENLGKTGDLGAIEKGMQEFDAALDRAGTAINGLMAGN